MTRLTAVTKWYSPKLGYGFLKSPDGIDIFIHSKELAKAGLKTLTENQSVTFEIGEYKSGKKEATRIELAP